MPFMVKNNMQLGIQLAFPELRWLHEGVSYVSADFCFHSFCIAGIRNYLENADYQDMKLYITGYSDSSAKICTASAIMTSA